MPGSLFYLNNIINPPKAVRISINFLYLTLEICFTIHIPQKKDRTMRGNNTKFKAKVSLDTVFHTKK